MQPEQVQPEVAPQPVPPAPQPRKKVWFIVGGIVLLLAIVVGAIFWLTSDHGKLTAAKVAKMDKTATFWQAFSNAAMQQQLVVAHEATSKGGTAVSRTKVGFDYTTKKIEAAHEVYIPAKNGFPAVDQRDRCYDGKQYYRDRNNGTWKPEDILLKTCTVEGIGYDESDGLNTGGLSAAQAKTFIDYLRGVPGFANVRSLTLETHNGKQYLHYRVDFVPVKVPRLDQYAGNINFGDAFAATKLNGDTWPYRYAGSFFGGAHLDYYVDPATNLPAYSVVTGIPPVDPAQAAGLPHDTEILKTTYQFGTSHFDVQISNTAKLSLGW